MKRLLLGILLLGVFVGVYAQEKATLSGYIRNAADGEVLLFANVFVQELETGTTTNHYGFYSITLPQGTYTLSISYLGYQTKVFPVTLKADLSYNIDMEEGGQVLQEVIVSGKAEDESVDAVSMSRIDLPIQQIKKLPSLFGEPDVIKIIQTLPGVTSAGEGTSAYFVRGGSADQNLVLIDEAPVYDVSHLFGLFSVFNSDIIKSAELYKGGIPSKYGGRLSSLLEVTTKDGNDKHLEGSGGIGLMAARLSLEGPIQKEKASFIVSGRRSYADLIMKQIDDLDGTTVSFYDMNAKVNWKPNNKNRFFISAYDGRDNWNFNDDFKMGWGNTTATFRWNHLFSEKLFSNTTLIYSDFDYRLEDLDAADGFVWDANQREMSLKEDLTYFINPKLTLQMGYQGIYRRFSPGTIQPNSDASIFKKTALQKMFALDHALYLGTDHKVSERLSLQYGLRFTVFQQIGKGTIYTYEEPENNVNIVVKDSTVYGNFENIKVFSHLEPRFNARYRLNPQSSLKFSYQRMAQYIHLISNSTVPIPFNTWAPSSPYLDPQIADQLALGYFQNFRNNTYEFSAETFYKKAKNVTAFADNANIFFNKHLATEFRQGEGESYGLELFVRKVKGDLQGFASYTLSKATMDIQGINEGEAFAANHDRLHNLNVALTYALNKQWDLGANFTYSSGRPITLPTGKFQFDNYQVDYYTSRNGYRLPDFHRLDLSVSHEAKKNEYRKFKQSFTAGLYNVYNQQNPFTIYTRKKQDEDGNIIGDGTEKEARLVYLFGIMPYFSWNFKF
ncbi:MAG: TonB-dependent receptor [Saprospiraceae bacterium]